MRQQRARLAAATQHASRRLRPHITADRFFAALSLLATVILGALGIIGQLTQSLLVILLVITILVAAAAPLLTILALVLIRTRPQSLHIYRM